MGGSSLVSFRNEINPRQVGILPVVLHKAVAEVSKLGNL